ncbi:hypothetical protein RB195_015283 [Necator americanus]|uniref:Uncharacterized protein n=1 Tax=Necator americanus TaxID=51031 RepID=A0ABR1E516_NECAM
MMQAKKIKYDVIGLTERRRRHPLNAVYDIGEELFLGSCDSRDVGGVSVLVNTSMAKNIDFFEELTIRTERLRMRRCGPTPALLSSSLTLMPSTKPWLAISTTKLVEEEP